MRGGVLSMKMDGRVSANVYTPTTEYPLCPLLTAQNHVVLCQKELCAWYSDEEDVCAVARIPDSINLLMK